MLSIVAPSCRAASESDFDELVRSVVRLSFLLPDQAMISTLNSARVLPFYAYSSCLDSFLTLSLACRSRGRPHSTRTEREIAAHSTRQNRKFLTLLRALVWRFRRFCPCDGVTLALFSKKRQHSLCIACACIMQSGDRCFLRLKDLTMM